MRTKKLNRNRFVWEFIKRVELVTIAIQVVDEKVMYHMPCMGMR